jgi:hypothetical protein
MRGIAEGPCVLTWLPETAATFTRMPIMLKGLRRQQSRTEDDSPLFSRPASLLFLQTEEEFQVDFGYSLILGQTHLPP